MSINLTTPLTLPCGAVLSNRLGKAPLTEGLADPMNRATNRHVRLYRRWSEGGCGLLVTGNVQVDRRYLERPGNVVIDQNDGLAELRDYARAGTAAGNHLWMQLNHPGRQTPSYLTARPVAPSAVPLTVSGVEFNPPRALADDEVEDVIRRFAHAAGVAKETGFTGVQVHGAHGYLLSQFLSPIANTRTDRWGGGLENRARLLLETVRAVRQEVGSGFPVAVKLNSADFSSGGFSHEESIQVATWLEREGIDLLEISGGTYEQTVMIGNAGNVDKVLDRRRESTKKREAYFLEYARDIRTAIKTPLMVSGGFRTRAGMIDALASGDTDVIGLGRPLCADAELGNKLLDGSVEHAPDIENHLRLGPGFLGPNSNISMIKAINTWGQMGWFCHQLIRLGEGQDPDLSLGLLAALRWYKQNEAATVGRLDRVDQTGGESSVAAQ
jgi:2,4-dienoyl-CoA reductase-like NADH-dependent reductase (Old Yellow Enzyme family)